LCTLFNLLEISIGFGELKSVEERVGMEWDGNGFPSLLYNINEQQATNASWR
jgi:hypothetical protein